LTDTGCDRVCAKLSLGPDKESASDRLSSKNKRAITAYLLENESGESITTIVAATR
jgi:hypothetical protein